MKRWRKLGLLLFTGAILAALGVFAFLSLQYRLPLGANTQAVHAVSDVTYETETGETGTLSLPGSLSGLAPRTTVTLYATIQAQPGDNLLVKSVFAPMKLYLDDTLIYEYGQEGTYPAFMNDPPTGLTVVELPKVGGTFTLRAEYQSLTQRSTLSIPAFYVGAYASLLDSLFHANGLSLLFSLILIFLGLAMSLLALTVIRKLPSGIAFLWLGLFSLSAGVWIFGECDLSAFFLPFPSLLYGMSYAGLFCITIPLLRFGLLVLNPRNRRPFTIMLWVHYVSVFAAFLLQLTGLMDFTKSLYWFHVIAPLGFVTFAASLIFERVRYHNPVARRFFPSIILLTVFVVLELFNYWFHLTGTLTVFFQLGALCFVVSLGIVSGYYVRASMQSAAEKNRLEYEMAAMERQLSLQRLQ